MRLFVVETCVYDENNVPCDCGTFLIKSETEPTWTDIKKLDEWEDIKEKLCCEGISSIYEIDMSELEEWEDFMIVELEKPERISSEQASLSLNRPSKRDYYVDIAIAVSKRSTCLKRHYGAVIVKNDEIISTGYNGAARGYANCCDKGHCPRMNVAHNSGDYSDCPAVHAEQNAVISASRKDMIGATLYLAGEEMDKNTGEIIEIKVARPCPICQRILINSGIKRIVSRLSTTELY